MSKWISWGMLVLLIVGVVVIAGRFNSKPTTPIVRVDIHQAAQPVQPSTSSIVLVYPQTTDELATLFQYKDLKNVPRVYLGAFPNDFSEKGTPELFMKSLLPLLLENNEQLELERAEFEGLAHKTLTGKPLTSDENVRYEFYVKRYDIVAPGRETQTVTLLSWLDRLSPSLALAQALEGTGEGHTNLTAPFATYYWDADKQYVRRPFDNLKQALDAYTLELNASPSYFGMHTYRGIDREMDSSPRGRNYAKTMKTYRVEDATYPARLVGLFDQYELDDYDDAKLEERK